MEAACGVRVAYEAADDEKGEREDQHTVSARAGGDFKMDRRTTLRSNFPVASFYFAPLCLSVSLVALAVEPEIVSDCESGFE